MLEDMRTLEGIDTLMQLNRYVTGLKLLEDMRTLEGIDTESVLLSLVSVLCVRRYENP